jgi:hypothetical protein
MSADWRVYAIAVVFGMYLGWLGGTRRADDRRDAIVALTVAFVVGIGFLLFGADNGSSELAATSLTVGSPVAIAGIRVWASRSS